MAASPTSPALPAHHADASRANAKGLHPGVLLDNLEEAVAVVDGEGALLLANAGWRSLSREYGWLCGDPSERGFLLDEARFQTAVAGAEAILRGLRSVLHGAQGAYECEFAPGAGTAAWLRLRAVALPGETQGLVTVSVQDVSARRKLEQDLRESHALFQHVIEGTGDAIFIFDMQGHFLMHNAVCRSLFPLIGQAGILGKRMEEVFPPEIAQTIQAQNQLVAATGRTVGYELDFETPGGRRAILVQKGLYRNHRSEPAGIIGIARDITGRKIAEEKLERSERHFRALIEKSADCIIILSREANLLYVSPAAKRIAGYDDGDLLGTNAFFWVHPDDLSAARQRFEELLELPGASVTAEYRTLCKDGNWKWMETTATNLLEDSSVQAVVLNIRDISERKEAEQALRRFEAIVESSIDGVFSVDPEGRVTSWNAAAERIFGYSEAEMRGASYRILVPEDRLEESREFAAAAFRGKALRDLETVRLARGGRRVEISLTLSPIQDRARRITGVAVIVRDISERCRLEKEVLEIADLEKHRIGQDLHDDLCQHLAGISMMGNLLYKELSGLGLKQAEDARQIAEMIRNAVDHARILAKGLSPLNIAQGGLMAGLEMLASNTETVFRMPCRFECPVAVHLEDLAVATHVYRIAQEALHNAVKHSRGTQAVITLETGPEGIAVTVRDDGVGLPESMQNHSGGGLGMHTMFYRARIIGATLQIARNATGGTSVVCRLPAHCARREEV